MRYREIPKEVDAVQFDGGNAAEIEAFTGLGSEDAANGRHFFMPGGFTVLREGDWLIKQGSNFAVCKPDIFEATYEAVPPVGGGA